MRCNGETNQGSIQMANLTTVLGMCEEEIKSNCDSPNLTERNNTADAECSDAIQSFKTKTGECLKKEGSGACTCWTNSSLTRMSRTIKTCDSKYCTKYAVEYLTRCVSVCLGQECCLWCEEMPCQLWDLQEISG